MSPAAKPAIKATKATTQGQPEPTHPYAKRSRQEQAAVGERRGQSHPVTGFRLDPVLKKELAIHAVNVGRTRSEIVGAAIREYLNRHEHAGS